MVESLHCYSGGRTLVGRHCGGGAAATLPAARAPPLPGGKDFRLTNGECEQL